MMREISILRMFSKRDQASMYPEWRGHHGEVVYKPLSSIFDIAVRIADHCYLNAEGRF